MDGLSRKITKDPGDQNHCEGSTLAPDSTKVGATSAACEVDSSRSPVLACPISKYATTSPDVVT